ncbi:hypothetical protein Cri9333_3914 [Crinalium epipsammum PCC 9333]|uniref:AB hydrolase-1 domain-containing protein n=1 Tax=Crinalium epipsammum PCC 9333 TaxID=1173022 RepID=K9W2Y1_9CYAN|nr:alpha/beta fold hydrolase [Crinalium epipsammum]AFZ14723.1 hypothetical protein Cri9333_3914 [Crinalium epipsammum PCC 9333]
MSSSSLNNNPQLSNYLKLKSEIIQETQLYETALLLKNENCRSKFLLHSTPTEKICLFFHGFTANPEQFLPIGEAFFKAGYNVLIPLLPGHGMAGNWDKDNPPPLPETKEAYQQFGIKWLQIAQGLGEKVILGGLSGGSTLAAWLALERAVQIHKNLIFAPYLSGSNPLVDLVVENLDIYFKWKTAPGCVSFGYGGFVMPALRVFLDMGEDILEQAKICYSAPMFIISSESDRAVGKHEHQELFHAVIQHQPKSWYYCFERELDIQHNMMTEAEGNKHADLVISLAKAYIESDLTWIEFKQMCDRLQPGDLNTVIHQLHIHNS